MDGVVPNARIIQFGATRAASNCYECKWQSRRTAKWGASFDYRPVSHWGRKNRPGVHQSFRATDTRQDLIPPLLMICPKYILKGPFFRLPLYKTAAHFFPSNLVRLKLPTFSSKHDRALQFWVPSKIPKEGSKCPSAPRAHGKDTATNKGEVLSTRVKLKYKYPFLLLNFSDSFNKGHNVTGGFKVLREYKKQFLI